MLRDSKKHGMGFQAESNFESVIQIFLEPLSV